MLYNENCLDTMDLMASGSVDLVVTSPPYDNLRDYKGYSFEFEKIAQELYRVVKTGGVVVWVVGDATIKGNETGTSFKQALYFKEIGFNLHDTMIWDKGSAAYPASHKSVRYSNIFEYMFVFSKGRPKTINLIKDKKNLWGGSESFGETSERQKDGNIKIRGKRTVAEYGYRNNIWRQDCGWMKSYTEKFLKGHPAIFPENIAKDHILTWSNKEDLVYDPFMGSGTVAKMAIVTGRKYIGSEISKEYCELAEKRIKDLKISP
jgi:site-specific DNA-methyltransferase (adenine-specific)